ncbi:MAG: hypothetical protein WA826_10070, partial [Silvibacterium sp.]
LCLDAVELPAREGRRFVGLVVKQAAVDIYFNPALQLHLLLREDEVPELSKERGEPLAEIIRIALSKTALGEEFSAAKSLSEQFETVLYGALAAQEKFAGESRKADPS